MEHTPPPFLNGLPVSPGYAMGRALVLRGGNPECVPVRITAEKVGEELQRFQAARAACGERLAALRKKSEQDGRAEEAEILDAHSELLLDEELEKDVAARIASDLLPAERAVAAVLDAIVAEMRTLEAEYARERSKDLTDLRAMILQALTGEANSPRRLAEPTIVVGRDLAPADTAALEKSLLLGIVSETGGRTSHVSIIARSLGIPAVVGVPDATTTIRDGDRLLVDGCDGRVFVNPDEALLAEYRVRQARLAEEQRSLEALRQVPAVTRDGRAVRLCANIGSEVELDQALRYGAEGIGLLRTEFLFLQRETMPSEEEQFQAYRQIAAALHGRPVIIRTLDVGGDKPLPYLPLPAEANPFLGQRGVRLYADWPELIRTQLRASLRASHFGAVHVMFPMIVSPDEIIGLRALLAEIQDGLRRAAVPFNGKMPVGIMVETPAAALIADRLIEHVDFFSVGANDLTQYTVAADRGHPRIADLCDPLHPAVLRLIRTTVDASHAAGKWTGVCGEVAGDETATALLLGLGVDELSMSPRQIPAVKNVLLRSTMTETQSRAQAACRAATAREVRALAAQRTVA